MKLIEFCACFTAKNEVKNIWANRVDIACFYSIVQMKNSMPLKTKLFFVKNFDLLKISVKKEEHQYTQIV